MRPKILFVHSSNESFIGLDRDLLSVSFELYDFFVRLKFPYKFMSYWYAIKNADLLFCWFASWNSFWALLFARILQKPSILVIGGYDVANLPVAGYGHQRGGLTKRISRWAMNLAGILIPFSKYSQQEAKKNAGIPADRMKVVYIGVPDPLGSLPKKHKEEMVLTVGKVEWANLKRKGLEPFVHIAKYLTEVKFVVVGEWADDSIKYLRSVAPTNVSFTGWIDEMALLEYYSRASVYIQASLHEGFGLSVAEAMLAGCIPVVANVGSLPEVVGNCGFYFNTDSPEEMANTIKVALKASPTQRIKARHRILMGFPLAERRKILEQIVRTVRLKNNIM